MATDDIAHLWRMRDAYKDVIRVLEEKQARFAGSLPTYMQIELEQARRDKEATEAKLQLLQPSDALGSDARLALVEYKLNLLRDAFQEAWLGDEKRRNDRQSKVDKHMLILMILSVLSLVSTLYVVVFR